MQIETRVHCSDRPQGAGPRRLRILAGLVLSLWIGLSLACSNESENRESLEVGGQAPEPEISMAQVQRNADPRPSVVLIVIDTLRADAVSAYGAVEGTTPTLDRLGRSGIRYQKAFAPAPWTVSSHATLFTGLRVDEHGVGLDGASVAPESLVMLAESFQDAGYETAGFAENLLVSHHFGLDQGFDHFESKDIVSAMKAVAAGNAGPPAFDLIQGVRQWHQERDPSRPYFLFINLYDPHDPYLARKENPWVPDGTSDADVSYVASQISVGASLCGAVPQGQDLEILRGLYLGDVAAADAKVATLLGILEDGAAATPNLTIVTSDHGEHLGEHRLMGHQFSLRNPVLEIPLIISGLPEAEPVVIERPVELRQLHQSILCWALDETCPASLPVGVPKEGAEPAAEETIISIYSDSVSRLPMFIVDQLDLPEDRDRTDYSRSKCDEEDHVFGDMVSMIRYPMKMIWFEKGATLFFDLSWDPGERSDQMEGQKERAAALLAELESFAQTKVVEREAQDGPELTEEGIRALEALGYVQ
jgi:hypothetical protein